MRENKRKKKQVRQPSRFLLWLARLFLLPLYRRRYGLTIDRSGLADLRGPAVVLAPHTSGKDHYLIGMALWPQLPTFVLSEHFMHDPRLRWVLKRLHVITKRMFSADAHTIMGIWRAKQSGRIIVLFPEGRQPACAHTLPLADGTAELIRRLGVNVYVVTANGASLTFPKWGVGARRGKIRVTTAKLFDGAEVGAMPPDEIRERIDAAIRHDDEAAMAGVCYRTDDTTLGLDRLLRRCPLCHRVGSLTAGGGHIRCTCGLDATLDETYRFHGAPFDSVNAWFDWQQAQIDPLREALETDVRVSAVDDRGNLVRDVGCGRVRMDVHTISFAGEVFGEGRAFRVPTEEVGGFPVAVGDHFAMYHGSELYQFSPVDDPGSVIDWVCYLDRVHEMQAAGEIPDDRSRDKKQEREERKRRRMEQKAQRTEEKTAIREERALTRAEKRAERENRRVAQRETARQKRAERLAKRRAWLARFGIRKKDGQPAPAADPTAEEREGRDGNGRGEGERHDQ